MNEVLNFLTDLSSFELENDTPENKTTNTYQFKNKNFKVDYKIQFNNNLSNQFKINGLTFQIKIVNNIVKLYGSKNANYKNELFDHVVTDFICDLFQILESEKIETKWKYDLFNYSCRLFSPHKLHQYIKNNVGSLYKVIGSYPDHFPQGIIKDKNDLIIPTVNNGYIKLYQVTENKPCLILDPFKNSKDQLIHYLTAKCNNLEKYLINLDIEIKLEKNNLNLRLDNLEMLRKHKLSKLSNLMDNVENAKKILTQEIKQIKLNYEQNLKDELDLFDNEYFSTHLKLDNIEKIDMEYKLRVEDIKRNKVIKQQLAIIDLKNNHYSIELEKQLNSYLLSINYDIDKRKQKLIDNIGVIQRKINKYTQVLNNIKSIDIDKVLLNFEKQLLSVTNILVETIDNPSSKKYRSDNGIKKLTNNQLNRNIKKTIERLENGKLRNLKFNRLLTEDEKIAVINRSKIEIDNDHFPIFLSSKLSDHDYRMLNNQWLHELNLTLVTVNK